MLAVGAAGVGLWMRDAALPRIEASEKTGKENSTAISDHDRRIQKLENETPLQLQRVDENTQRTNRLVEEIARQLKVPVPP